MTAWYENISRPVQKYVSMIHTAGCSLFLRYVNIFQEVVIFKASLAEHEKFMGFLLLFLFAIFRNKSLSNRSLNYCKVIIGRPTCPANDQNSTEYQ